MMVLINRIWLVVDIYPSEKYMSSSLGMMTFRIYGKVKHVPNHQAEYDTFMLYSEIIDQCMWFLENGECILYIHNISEYFIIHCIFRNLEFGEPDSVPF